MSCSSGGRLKQRPDDMEKTPDTLSAGKPIVSESLGATGRLILESPRIGPNPSAEDLADHIAQIEDDLACHASEYEAWCVENDKGALTVLGRWMGEMTSSDTKSASDGSRPPPVFCFRLPVDRASVLCRGG